jgi:subtilisin family serine protease
LYAQSDIEDLMWLYRYPESLFDPHGTILAGIAGAYAENGVGVAGNCWDCSLLVLRVSVIVPSDRAGCTHEGCRYSEQVIADAIKFAAGWSAGDHPDDPDDPINPWGPVRARVICTALESAFMDVCDSTNLVSKAVDNAFDRGCVIVAIAGNKAPPSGVTCWTETDPDLATCTMDSSWVPGLITHGLSLNPKTITVGGTCRTGLSWHCHSRINPPIEDLGSCGSSLYPILPLDNTAPILSIVAPIEDMVLAMAFDEVTGFGSEYGFFDENKAGTSGAAPQVAGVVALMLGVDPSLTPTQVKFILESTALDIDDPGYDRRTGHGLLNAQAAIEYVMKQEFPADWDGDGLVAPIDAVLFAVDLATGNVMTDLNLDANQTADDMTIFLNSYAGN